MTAMATTATGFPAFAPGEHRQLLADVNRWRRTNGWTLGHIRGYINGRFTNEATTAVDWLPADENPEGFTVTRRDESTGTWPVPDFYRTASVRQAVDLLAVLGILPVAFSSAYQQGRSDAAWTANVDTSPDRKCRFCDATSGLKPVISPLNSYRTYQCWDGCRDSAR